MCVIIIMDNITILYYNYCIRYYTETLSVIINLLYDLVFICHGNKIQGNF